MTGRGIMTFVQMLVDLVDKETFRAALKLAPNLHELAVQLFMVENPVALAFLLATSTLGQIE